MNLTSENVTAIFERCLSQSPDHGKKIEAVMNTFMFYPEQLEKDSDNIFAMLNQLPANFKLSEGGGWTFLYACQNKDNEQWTDFQSTVEYLVALGLAIEKVEFQLPRDMWKLLPGGVPYFFVKD